MNLNIQFMRGFAALIVLMFHTAPQFYATGGAADKPNIFTITEKFGYMGVDIFFVISGYIMWLTTQNLNDKYPYNNSVSFLYNRLTRIYLGYWVFFIAVFVGYHFLGKDMSHVNLLSSFFLTSAKIDQLLIPVSWTLTYELYFYFSFALLLFLNKSYRFTVLKILFFIILAVQIYIYYFA